MSSTTITITPRACFIHATTDYSEHIYKRPKITEIVFHSRAAASAHVKDQLIGHDLNKGRVTKKELVIAGVEWLMGYEISTYDKGVARNVIVREATFGD
jgi:hypothetical protein